MAVTSTMIRQALRDLGLSGRPLCVHSSLRSFGTVAGGAQTVVDGLLAEGCTVLVPTFSSDAFAVPPPVNMRPPRNGSRYDASPDATVGMDRTYTTEAREIDPDMGAIPAAVLAMSGHVRGDHPLCSFSAVGSRAGELVAGQQPLDVYAPLRALAEMDGAAICMGVDLNRMTLLHLAEREAGRNLFRRWANGPDGRPIVVEAGGCSEGFDHFEPVLAPIERRAEVGESRWWVFPAADALRLATAAIRADPAITHCTDPACERCNDAVQGGPLLTLP